MEDVIDPKLDAYLEVADKIKQHATRKIVKDLESKKEDIHVELKPDVTRSLLRVYPHFKEFVSPAGRFIGKLNKCLYGLIISAHELWLTMTTTLVEKDGI